MKRSDILFNLYQQYLENGKGRGKCVIITGEAGIGKTYTAETFLDSKFEKDMVILKGSAQEEQQTPYYPLLDAFVSYYLSEKSILRKKQLLKILVENIPQLFHLAQLHLVIPLSKQKIISREIKEYPHTEPYQFFYQYLQFLKYAGKGKELILFLDDLQWFDPDSWQFFLFLMEKMSTERFFLICTYRTGSITNSLEEKSRDVFEILELSKNRNNLEIIPLEPFQLSDYDKLVEDLLGSSHLFSKKEIKLLFSETEGNPYYLDALLKLMKEEDIIIKVGDKFKLSKPLDKKLIPISVEKAILRRLEKIYKDIPSSQKMLNFAAVLGERFRANAVSELLNSEIFETYRKLRDIEKKYYLVKRTLEEDWYRFDHRKTKEIICKDLGFLLPKLHLHIAQYFEECGDVSPDIIAYHYKNAGSPSKSLQYLFKSHDIAKKNSMFFNARFFLEEAFNIIEANPSLLEEEEIIDYNLEYVQALYNTNDFERAIHHLKSFEVKLRSSSNKNNALYKKMAGMCYYRLGKSPLHKKAVKFLEESLDLFLIDEYYEDAGKVSLFLVPAYDRIQEYEKSKGAFDKSISCFEKSGSEVLIAEALRKSGVFYDSRIVIDNIEHALSTFTRYSMKHEIGKCLNNQGSEYFYMGKFDRAEDKLRKSIKIFKELGGYRLDTPTNNLGLIYLKRGDLSKAMNLFQKCLSYITDEVRRLFITINIATVYRFQERYQDSIETMEKIEREINEFDEPLLSDYYYFNYGMIHSDMNDFKRSIDLITKCPPHSFKDDDKLIEAKRLKYLSKAHEKLGNDKKAKEFEKKSTQLFDSKRPSKWFYEINYYPCDIQFWST